MPPLAAGPNIVGKESNFTFQKQKTLIKPTIILLLSSLENTSNNMMVLKPQLLIASLKYLVQMSRTSTRLLCTTFCI